MKSSPLFAGAGITPGRLVAGELVVLTCALLVMLAGFLFELGRVRSEAAHAFARRADVAGGYLQSRLQTADALANQFRTYYGEGALADVARVKSDPAHKGWVLSGRGRAGAADTPRGSATGLPPLTGAQQRELGAALALEADAGRLLVDSKDLSAVYYLSANRFLYVLPGVSPGPLRFSEALYRMPAWPATPPLRNDSAGPRIAGPRIAGLHEAAAGSGLVVTIAVPVVVRQRFLGIVGLDLGLEMLRKLVAAEGGAGELLLVDRSGRIVAREGAFPRQETWPLPASGARHWRDDEGAEWRARPLAGGQLLLLQRLGTPALLRAAGERSVPLGLSVLLLAVVGILMLRLRQALAELSLQDHRDPLTRALNRRGLYEGAEAMRALATRSLKPLAVVMFDIDAFKKVNETQGHERGDKVLVALMHGLQHQLRDYDVLCRWSGEEFVAVLMLEAAADAIPVAERLRNMAATACLREALTLVTISAGMAMWREDETLDAAIARADQSLMAAKAGGRDRLDVSAEVAAAAD